MRVLLPGLFLLAACGHPEPASAPAASAAEKAPAPRGDGPLRIEVGQEVVRADVHPFGINLGAYHHYGTGQITRNLIGRNPGFEPSTYRSLVTVAQGTADGFSDTGPPGAWATGFWDGASFEVVQGTAVGRTGTITAFTRTDAGGRYRWAAPGSPPAPGDLVALRKQDAAPTTGWWPQTRGAATLTAETDDLPPGVPGRQALHLSAPTASDGVDLHHYFDAPKAGHAMAPMRGRHVLRFHAKALTPGTVLAVQLRRHVQPNRVYLHETVALSPDWQEVTLAFDAMDDAAEGIVDLYFRLSAGRCLLDAVSLVKEGTEGAFRAETVAALKKLQPGILRYWAGQLGADLEALTAPADAVGPSGYSRWGKEPLIQGYALPDFLTLCLELKAEPWVVLPLTLTPAERRDLIAYLAGPAQTPMGQRRAAAGRTAPWTEAFSRIHLEWGNEAWNSSFDGGNLSKPEAYGALCTRYNAELRGAPSFDPATCRLVVGGQAVWAGRNATILKHTAGADVLAIAPYLLHQLDAPTHPLAPAARLFAEVDHLGREGFLGKNREVVDAGDPRMDLAVYEVNLHTTQGSASEETLRMTVSAAAATGTVAHMLGMLYHWAIRDSCFYTYNQYDFKRGDQKAVPLWGAVTDVAGSPRPVYLALQAVHEVMHGDMVAVHLAGHLPAYQLGDVQVAVPLQAYGFRDAAGFALVVANLNPEQEARFLLGGVAAPTGPVTVTRLAFASPLDTNEQGQRVRLETDAPVAWTADTWWTVAPAGLAVFRWVNGGKY